LELARDGLGQSSLPRPDFIVSTVGMEIGVVNHQLSFILFSPIPWVESGTAKAFPMGLKRIYNF
jgi:hypothetical protein